MEFNEENNGAVCHIPNEIWDYILELALIDNNGNPCVEDIKSCRLVSKHFLNLVSACLAVRKKPVFQLVFNYHYYSDGKSPVIEKKKSKMISQFVTHMTDDNSVYRQLKPFRVPPYSLTMHVEWLSLAMINDFRDCLEKCGEGLVKLELIFPTQNGEKGAFDLNKICLPNLRTYTLSFAKRAAESSEDNDLPHHGSKLTFVQFVFAVVQCCVDLKVCEFQQDYVGLDDEDEQPLSLLFDTVIYPKSLETLDICVNVDSKHLEKLGNHDFPVLTTLSLIIPTTPFHDGDKLLHRVLQNVSQTLKQVNFYGLPPDGRETRETSLRLPLLPNLKGFVSDSLQLELASGQRNLQKCLPRLTNLTLDNQSGKMLSKWTGSSTFESVTSLEFSLFDETYDGSDYNFKKDVDNHIMDCVSKAFPNLTVLLLECFGNDFSGIRFLFEHMRQLMALTIVVSTDKDHEQSSDAWDSLLLGISPQSAAELRTNPDLWNNLDFQNDASVFPSFRNLQELQRFELAMDPRISSGSNDISTPISDIVFQLAVREMSKLNCINLSNGFKASDEAISLWESKGRLLDVR